MLEEGKKAPEFTLSDSDGKKHSLKDYSGKKVIIYFYPKDNTPGCTKESCEFRDNLPNFNNTNAVVIGVSPDSEKSHRKFADKYELPFTLLSDESKEMLMKYGVWKEKSMYGRKYMGVERTTVIIDEKGNVQKIYPKVKVSGHVEQVLKDINQ
ncbi:MAG: thioredoxin-dependent thiol peroxidase [Melioribacteraceae bacterium]|nr:thioredoxin-dependent thiol peroxidase [Melioribacteraceae bacterium]MCF8265026.1 thioredoxin-dependent thiol peroxidase [Melioribacteraceae bacterium]MCF8413811.1 thioredoxin-dependent thiol peroxidase [Melioribacteraceae bacterium]